MGKRLDGWWLAMFTLSVTVGVQADENSLEPKVVTEAEQPPAFRLRAATYESGGGEAFGGNFVIRGSLGQPEPFVSESDRFRVRGGLLPARVLVDSIFSDGFESGDTGAWTITAGSS